MAASIPLVDEAFATMPSLRKRIYALLEQESQHRNLFEDIGTFVLSQNNKSDNMAYGNGHVDGPLTKKRRMDDSERPAGVLLFEAREISFSLPQRKKLHLGLIDYGRSSYSIQLRNPSTNQVESTYPLEQYSHALRLPIPEKNQKQYNFCLIPSAQHVETIEPIIWTVNHGPLKSYKFESDELRSNAPGPENVLENILNHVLKATGSQLVIPTDKEFTSMIRESHRKNDLTYHVKAFRGSKEGYLFFLENGIFFGFKKPLTFFSFDDIESVSYTSVLQRTFNLNITAKTGKDGTMQEIEFSMLDQQDFAGIDDYIKRHSLQDASLAEARRAKKTGKGTKNAESGGDGDQTELEKAQQEMEDEEDELEEDYDPDEDGDGSDSGSESEEEEYTVGKGRNLIAEELGSEAEDVSVTDDEEEEEEEEEEEIHNKHQQAKQPQKAQRPQKMAVEPKKSANIPTHAGRSQVPSAPDLDDEDQL